ncbi:MAG: hypothetical protein CMM52_03435 [Rhodospirillaceae bacterium]|nr:hypothetical protein [Rhodospirillaceae bacterium]
MFSFILADGNLPFAVALGLMLGIAVLEGVMTLLGAGISQAIDSLLPESLGDVDLDADLDIAPDMDSVDGSGADFGDAQIGSPTALSKLLGWLCVGKVPVLILLVTFLTVFGLAGLFVQSVVHGITGALLPGVVASIPAFIIAVPSVRLFGSGVARLTPKDETAAVTSKSFVGRIATITIGTARKGEPAEAKLQDTHGQTHYVMVEPEKAEDAFDAGTQVLIIQKEGARFIAILNTNPALVDE